MKKTRILVVDDEAAICELTGAFLKKKNYEVSCAANAKEALDLVAKERPQLVLLDIRLGEESGLDVLRKIRETDKNIKVIMVTAMDDEGDIRRAKELGADDYVVKPITAGCLHDLVLQKISMLSAGKNK